MPRRDETQDLSSVTYRDGVMVECPCPITLGILKEVSLDPKNPVDAGVLKAYESMKGVRIVPDGARKVAKYGMIRDYPLHEAINMKKPGRLPILSDLDLERRLPAPGQGIVFIGRGNPDTTDYIPTDEFRNDPTKIHPVKKTPQTFTGTIEEFMKDYLDSIPEENKAFFDVAGQLDLPKNVGGLRSLLTSLDDATKAKIMQAYTTYVVPRLLSITPTVDGLKSQPDKNIWLDCACDSAITIFGQRKDKSYRAQGVFYPLRRGSDIILNYADFSKNGSEIRIWNATRDQVLPSVEKELKYDAGDPFVKIAEVGTKDAGQCVKQTSNNHVIVDLRRKDGSSLTHVPVMNLSDGKKQMVSISIGDVDPSTETRENTLVLMK